MSFSLINDKQQSDEIGDIGWFTYDQAMNLIRPHHTDRRKLLTQLYTYVITKILEVNKNKKVLI